jgi:uncharacterized protein YegP (UPF0339 family)
MYEAASLNNRYNLTYSSLKIGDKGVHSMAKFEIFQDRKGQFRWRLLANNNQVIATGEGYTSKAGCKNGIESVKKNASKAKIEDLT